MFSEYNGYHITLNPQDAFEVREAFKRLSCLMETLDRWAHYFILFGTYEYDD